MMQTSPIRIGSLPIGLICTDRADIAFVRLAQFKAIYDYPTTKDGIDAMFDAEGFSIGDTCFDWGVLYNYKEIPEMLTWLQRQNLNNPFQGENE